MKERRAFTLIELLIVIAIIGVLVAITVPIISSSVTEANQTGCMTNLKTIGTAMTTRLPQAISSGGSAQQFPLIHNAGDPNDVTLDQGDDAAALTSENAMQNVFLLIADGLLPESAFHCPADGAWTQVRFNVLR